MKWIKSFTSFMSGLVNKVSREIKFRKKLKETRKHDPFIYK